MENETITQVDAKQKNKINQAQAITPCLWFDTNAEEAANFYVSVFTKIRGSENSRITNISYYGDSGPMPKGTALTVSFELDGQKFMALNGGPHFKFSEAVSFVIHCDTQAELDIFWDQLSDGGQIQMCGWLKDKYGLSWQVVPTIIGQLMSDKDPQKSARVMDAILQMKKLDVATLQKAYEGK